MIGEVRPLVGPVYGPAFAQRKAMALWKASVASSLAPPLDYSPLCVQVRVRVVPRVLREREGPLKRLLRPVEIAERPYVLLQ